MKPRIRKVFYPTAGRHFWHVVTPMPKPFTRLTKIRWEYAHKLCCILNNKELESLETQSATYTG